MEMLAMAIKLLCSSVIKVICFIYSLHRQRLHSTLCMCLSACHETYHMIAKVNPVLLVKFGGV